MAQSLIACPLCSAASFSSTNALCLSLVNVASKWLRCTLCEEELRGIDKLTIHLLGHLMNNSEFKRNLSLNNSCVLEPLNLVKSQDEQLQENSDQEMVLDKDRSIVFDSKGLAEDLSERFSLKVDDEVMILFNSNEKNKQMPEVIKGLENKYRAEVGLEGTENEITPTNSLQRFNLDFAESVSDIQGSRTNHIALSSDEQSHTNLTDPASHFIFTPHQKPSKNCVVPQVELSSINNENKSTRCFEVEFSANKNHNEHYSNFCLGETSKSSFLSPNGERVIGYRCDVCSLVFPDEHILSMHRQLIHVELNGDPSNSRTFKCHLCSKSFVMKGSLMVHMRVAHFGGAVVARLVETKQLETNAVSPESAQYVCSICNKGFRKEQQLIQHEKLHDGKQCDICLKTFTTKYFLRKHKRLHTGEMPYTCHVCNKSFTFQQSYHKHLLYHSDEKPHTCPDCGRSFKELSTLHNHQRIHTGEKPFSCDTCGMLTQHVVLIQFTSTKGSVFAREFLTWFIAAFTLV